MVTGSGRITASGKGSLIIHLTDEDGEKQRVDIGECLRISSLPVNLLSVSKLCEKGVFVEFGDKEAIIKAMDGTTFIAEKVSGLYVLEFHPVNLPKEAVSLLSLSQHRNIIYKVHNTLNHMPLRKMKEKVVNGQLDSILTEKERRAIRDFSMDEFECDACVTIKSVKFSLPSKSNHTTHTPLELVSSDVSGPMSDVGCYLLLLDVHTDFVFISDFVDTVTGNFTMLTTERFFELGYNIHGKYPNIFRCDRGRNYTAQIFTDMLADFGTRQQMADTGDHEQNGHFERKIRTLETRALTIWTVSNLPRSFLRDAIRHVVMMDNRTPGKQAPFGCRAVAVQPAHLRRKGVSRTLETVFLGYAAGSKDGFLLLRMDNGGRIVRRSVRFFPDTFPYADLLEEEQVELLRGSSNTVSDETSDAREIEREREGERERGRG